MKVSKICLTGGPCGGKSSALEILNDELTNCGYHVIIIKESATELKNNNKLTGKETDEEFASMIIKYQLQKERKAEELAMKNNNEYVIICDRSAIEPAAYIGIEKVADILAKYGKKYEQIYESYDLIIHLTTAAKGAIEFYTLDNNDARDESAAQAITLDDSFLQIWSKHQNRVIVDNSMNGFDEKLKRVKNIVINYLQRINNFER